MVRARIFLATRDFERSVTNLLDLLHPLIAGLWSLRIAVAGYVAERPSATESELQARFLTGSGIHGSGLRPMLGHTWDDQQAGLGTLALFAVIALYEAWTMQITEFLPARVRKPTSKALQWPPRSASPMTQPPPGVDEAIRRFTETKGNHPDAMIALARVSESHWSVRPERLPALLTVYRAFKERRNMLAHRAGRADDFAVMWDKAAARYSPSDLGLRFSLRIGGLLPAADATVDSRQVSSLIRVLLQIAATVDTLASQSRNGEKEVARRFPISRVRGKAIRIGGTRLNGHVRNLLRDVGLPAPQAMDDVTRMLRRQLLF